MCKHRLHKIWLSIGIGQGGGGEDWFVPLRGLAASSRASKSVRDSDRRRRCCKFRGPSTLCSALLGNVSRKPKVHICSASCILMVSIVRMSSALRKFSQQYCVAAMRPCARASSKACIGMKEACVRQTDGKARAIEAEVGSESDAVAQATAWLALAATLQQSCLF